MAGGSPLLPGVRPDAGQARRIKDWVRQAWALPDAATVLVTELQCTEPGCPPRETVIAVLDGSGANRLSRLHKSIAEVTAQDIEGVALPGC